jgi:methylenetetrahydrofolate reductase (NADPH)
MNIVDLYRIGEPIISFEFFPPKTDRGYQSLYKTIADLEALQPGFVSVTMGAGGSSSARSHNVDLVIRIQRELGLTSVAHLPCMGFSQGEIANILDTLGQAGVRNILALRGDPPRETPDFQHPEDGFNFANELTSFIARRGGFSIAGACYPEVHPDASNAEADLVNLKRKVDAGAEFLITQLFFDNQKFFDFEKRVRGAGIEVPIIPGIMPITSVAGIRRMTSLGGSSIPRELEKELAGVESNPEATLEVGIAWATLQCRELIQKGVAGIHFFTLNRSPATRRIHNALEEMGLLG